MDLGYRLGKKYWGKGIASETVAASLSFGFEDLELEKIYGWVMPDNKASIRIMEKFKFRLDAHIFEDGVPVNQYVLENLAEI